MNTHCKIGRTYVKPNTKLTAGEWERLTEKRCMHIVTDKGLLFSNWNRGIRIAYKGVGDV